MQAGDLPPDGHMWSNDTILSWPERMPAWEDKAQALNSGTSQEAETEQTSKAEADSGVVLLQSHHPDSRFVHKPSGPPPDDLDKATGKNQGEVLTMQDQGCHTKVIQVACADDASKVTEVNGSCSDPAKVVEVSGSSNDRVKMAEGGETYSDPVQVQDNFSWFSESRAVQPQR